MKPDIWEDYEQFASEADSASNHPSQEEYNPSQEEHKPLQVADNEPKQPDINKMFNGLLSRTDLDDEPFTTDDLARVEEWQYREEQRLIQVELEKRWREELRQKIEPYILSASDRLPDLKPVIAHKGVVIGSEGNISAVVGEAKSKKTFFCTAVVGSLTDTYDLKRFGIEHRLCKVLWIDTEQSREHIQKVLFRINLLSSVEMESNNPFVLTQSLREEKPSDRQALMEYAIQYFQPKLVVVDGVSDLLTNTNNLEESEALVARLLTLSTQYKCHIMNVLHTNPNSDKARGHLGSTLMRKAETVIFVHRTGEKSIVEPQYCRNEPFERFAFQVVRPADYLVEKYPRAEGLGLPEECELPAGGEDKEDDCVRILREEFGGCAERKLLCSKVEERLGVTPSYSRTKVARAIERGLILCDDKILTVA